MTISLHQPWSTLNRGNEFRDETMFTQQSILIFDFGFSVFFSS